MMITPIPGSNVFTVRYNRLYWSLVGPNGLPECRQEWRVFAISESAQWPVTGYHATKWQAIAALLRLINKPWTY